MDEYQPHTLEPKWQKIWADAQAYAAPDTLPVKENYLLLTEFPYPSGNLHIGHWYAFALPDIRARYLRMSGYNVLYPIGFDAFGLPAENAAIQRGINPREWTEKNIAYMSQQLRSMGATFDWSRVIATIDPAYYRWTQWLFLKLYEKGLAYRAATLVNWCPKDKTVLANEQVVNGLCERCDTPVVQKEITQWLFKITAYADRLVDDLAKLDWPATTKQAQRNWIGRKEGITITYKIKGSSQTIACFTTRPDTNFGATFIVLAPEHPFAVNLKNKEVQQYSAATKHKTELERLSEGKKKTGVFTGYYAVNNLNGRLLPIWVSDFVLGHFGTGAVVGVPGHDIRDFEFSQTFGLDVLRVVVGPDGDTSPITQSAQAQEEQGTMINSEFLDGLDIHAATQKIMDHLEAKGWGKREVTYRLHDWVLSRQRYWGVPIPMIHCESCARLPDGQGYQPVPEKDLPVELPPLDDYLPTEDGRSPLAKATDWVKVKCPQCGHAAQRETDTMDTFVDSSWYFMRYTDPHNNEIFADENKMKQWLPVPMYVGGAEHNTMHLLYSRFFTKALHDLGHVFFGEPFIKRVNHGIILGSDNQKMSKSRGNVIDPDKEVATYGADTIRLYLAFMAPYEQGGPWDPKGINGVSRFLHRVWRLVHGFTADAKTITHPDADLALHQAIKKIGADINQLHLNTGVSELMKLLNTLEEKISENHGLSRSQHELFLKLLAPFAPHITEELWHSVLGHDDSIHEQTWPAYDEALLAQAQVKIPVQINGKVRAVLDVAPGLSQNDAESAARALPNVERYLKDVAVKKIIFVPDRLLNFVVTNQ